MTNKLKCPKCQSDKIVKSGRVIRAGGLVQRHQCKNCGYPFVEKTLPKQPCS